jgi:hypothetical protein
MNQSMYAQMGVCYFGAPWNMQNNVQNGTKVDLLLGQ